MKINLLFCLFIFTILISCQREDPLEGTDINGFGGPQKDFSFEDYGSFYSYNAYVDKLIAEDTSGALIPPLALTGSRIAIFTENGTLHKVFEKQVEWSSKLEDENFPVSSIVTDKNGNFYFISVSGELVSLDNKGKIKWKNNVSDSLKKNIIFSELMIYDNFLFFADNYGNLYAYSIDGKLLWNKVFPLTINRTLSISETGKIIITLTNDEFGGNDKIVSLDKNGEIIFEKELKGVRLFRSPSIFNNQMILTGVEQINADKNNLIICIDTLGKEIWRKKIDLFPRYSSIGKDGLIFIVGFNSGIGEPLSVIYCFDEQGKEKWKLYYDVTIKTPIMISQNKLAFLGIKDNLTAVFFLKKDGVIINHISLNDAPLVNITPTVRSDGVICFAAMNKLQIVRIDDTFLNKLLPW
ncbi:MAG: PQQ-binding-like beta-propeller repeat protein [Candidatus Kapabacteria bacterium]|nr:PQQ-binding-like beta-propeller repeat protein [Candidatus Kapabacteria bacterium]